jgi:hypothetical protein
MTTEQLLEEANMKLMRASVDILNLGVEIAELRKIVRLQKAQLTVLECKLYQFDGLAEVT